MRCAELILLIRLLSHPDAQVEARFSASLAHISNWMSAHHLKLSLNNPALLFSRLESPALCKASPSPLTPPCWLQSRQPRRVRQRHGPSGLLFFVVRPIMIIFFPNQCTCKSFSLSLISLSGFCSSHGASKHTVSLKPLHQIIGGCPLLRFLPLKTQLKNPLKLAMTLCMQFDMLMFGLWSALLP